LGLAFIVQVLFLDYYPWRLISWAAFLLGAILPDIDCCSSKIHRWLLFPRLYGTRFKHWGHCHSIVGAAVFALPCFLLMYVGIYWAPLFAACGYILHLIVDEGYKARGNKRKALKWW
jgi:membrane-bound metal-dependent hydrolase YbcI (DUF457 family)